MSQSSPPIPKAFLWRRLHSLMGLGLVLFICEHLLTNSQTALFLGHDGAGFIRAVNFIHSLPYLPVIEVSLLGLPLLVHALWGIHYLFTSEPNSRKSSGDKPSLGSFSRNKAYTWQRITSWFLLLAIAAHVIQMRFYNYPVETILDGHHVKLVRLSMDDGLYTVAHRLNVPLYDLRSIQEEDSLLSTLQVPNIPPASEGFDLGRQQLLVEKQELEQKRAFVEALKVRELSKNQVIAAADSMGKAFLLVLRDTFKDPAMMVLYSLFVLSATYHAFNGLWTFLITWGVSLTERSQSKALFVSKVLMGTFSFLGLACIWGTYWLNLKM